VKSAVAERDVVAAAFSFAFAALVGDQLVGL